MPILVLALGLFLFPTEEMKEFSKHSNGMAEYRFVAAKTCDTGLRDTGFAFAPSGNVYLKQVNTDGTIAPEVCREASSK
ncbi:hypothetical protein AB8880_10055 [Alphaproteobacteria bacterium LSUCC0684]